MRDRLIALLAIVPFGLASIHPAGGATAAEEIEQLKSCDGVLRQQAYRLLSDACPPHASADSCRAAMTILAQAVRDEGDIFCVRRTHELLDSAVDMLPEEACEIYGELARARPFSTARFGDRCRDLCPRESQDSPTLPTRRDACQKLLFVLDQIMVDAAVGETLRPDTRGSLLWIAGQDASKCPGVEAFLERLIYEVPTVAAELLKEVKARPETIRSSRLRELVEVRLFCDDPGSLTLLAQRVASGEAKIPLDCLADSYASSLPRRLWSCLDQEDGLVKRFFEYSDSSASDILWSIEYLGRNGEERAYRAACDLRDVSASETIREHANKLCNLSKVKTSPPIGH